METRREAHRALNELRPKGVNGRAYYGSSRMDDTATPFPQSFLETRRLRLRSWVEADAARLSALHGNRQVMRHIKDGRTQSPPEVAAWIEQAQRHWEEHGFGLWAATRKDDGFLIGWIGLQVVTWLPEEISGIEIGWLIDPDYWGRGFATEGGRASLQFRFGPLDLDRIVSICQAENRASERVMEKIGMRFKNATRHPRLRIPLLVYEADAKNWARDRARRPKAGSL